MISNLKKKNSQGKKQAEKNAKVKLLKMNRNTHRR